MSKTIKTHRNIRWNLMTTASALALSVAIYGAAQAGATDADRPTLWVDLGGQFEQLKGTGDPYAPPFTSEIVADGFISPLTAQRALSGSFGEEGAISFQPEGSDWIFSAAIRYGRASGGTTQHNQTKGCPCLAHVGSNPPGYISPPGAKFSETNVHNDETHTLLDFQVGKDIGLGLFGSGGKSTVKFGVRFAQFTSGHDLQMRADPDFDVPTNVKYAQHHHTYAVTSQMERSFRGVGPSISWNASAALAGNPEAGEIAFDWGANAAVLFGRQRTRGNHETIGTYHVTGLKYRSTIPIHRSGNLNRSRSVTVPNVGGFAGLSFRYPDAKISVGYRGDFFLGAMDGGIDTRKSTTLGFNGPYASISFGLGD